MTRRSGFSRPFSTCAALALASTLCGCKEGKTPKWREAINNGTVIKLSHPSTEHASTPTTSSSEEIVVPPPPRSTARSAAASTQRESAVPQNPPPGIKIK